MAYYKRITEQLLTRPDGSEVQLSPNTLQKWTSEYRRFGLEALIPKERADKGSTRALTPEAEEDTAANFQKVLKDAITRFGIDNLIPEMQSLYPPMRTIVKSGEPVTVLFTDAGKEVLTGSGIS